MAVDFGTAAGEGGGGLGLFVGGGVRGGLGVGGLEGGGGGGHIRVVAGVCVVVTVVVVCCGGAV